MPISNAVQYVGKITGLLVLYALLVFFAASTGEWMDAGIMAVVITGIVGGLVWASKPS